MGDSPAAKAVPSAAAPSGAAAYILSSARKASAPLAAGPLAQAATTSLSLIEHMARSAPFSRACDTVHDPFLGGG